jgi:hypothetical protein
MKISPLTPQRLAKARFCKWVRKNSFAVGGAEMGEFRPNPVPKYPADEKSRFGKQSSAYAK